MITKLRSPQLDRGHNNQAICAGDAQGRAIHLQGVIVGNLVARTVRLHPRIAICGMDDMRAGTPFRRRTRLQHNKRDLGARAIRNQIDHLDRAVFKAACDGWLATIAHRFEGLPQIHLAVGRIEHKP